LNLDESPLIVTVPISYAKLPPIVYEREAIVEK